MSAGRFVLSAALGTFVAFILVQLWIWSAQFSWSSDGWIEALPVVLFFTGIAAGLLAALIIAFQWLRSRE
jgi:hypothetical protein